MFTFNYFPKKYLNKIIVYYLIILSTINILVIFYSLITEIMLLQVLVKINKRKNYHLDFFPFFMLKNTEFEQLI